MYGWWCEQWQQAVEADALQAVRREVEALTGARDDCDSLCWSASATLDW
ncbi:MAG: hypothetical protein M3N04_02515 [Actinomycetota bacterium]|nr:hypothetical protein [Actinomycetota bacterium]